MRMRQLILGVLLFLSIVHVKTSLAQVLIPPPEGSVAVQIKMNKDTFAVAEPIEGRIFLQNTFMLSAKSTFDIELFHDKRLVTKATTTEMTIPYGRLVFSFRDFGVPVFNQKSGSEGEWRIKITPKGFDKNAGEIIIHIGNSGGKK